jgi:hypothetical protein
MPHGRQRGRLLLKPMRSLLREMRPLVALQTWQRSMARHRVQNLKVDVSLQLRRRPSHEHPLSGDTSLKSLDTLVGADTHPSQVVYDQPAPDMITGS